MFHSSSEHSIQCINHCVIVLLQHTVKLVCLWKTSDFKNKNYKLFLRQEPVQKYIFQYGNLMSFLKSISHCNCLFFCGLILSLLILDLKLYCISERHVQLCTVNLLPACYKFGLSVRAGSMLIGRPMRSSRL